MKRALRIIGLCCTLACTNPDPAAAWGVWGHNHINKGAIMALPAEMGMFFYNHADFIIQESTVPDLRKYTIDDKAEFPRHYIDLELYPYHGQASMPATLKELEKQYSADSLNKYGILPWYIQQVMDKLTDAFRNKRKTEILFLAADLGHYIADAHMPLHTTVNHNGQLTGQQGIHAFWESQLPEMFGKEYNLYVPPVTAVKDIAATTWGIVDSSHALMAPLLNKEAGMRKDNPADKTYSMGKDGKPAKNKYGSPKFSYEYAHVYHELLGGMVESQMRNAIRYTAAFWYTAWVNAGKPDLADLDADYMTAHNKSLYKQDMKAWKDGKVKGCASDKDFD